MGKSKNNNNLKTLKILSLRFLSIIFLPIFVLIPIQTKTFIYNLFPNEFCRVITLIVFLVIIFAWFIHISKLIYKIENK